MNGRLRVYGNRRRLPARIESCLYRVAQEATNNVIKHAKVDSFSVSLKYAENEVELLVKDRGRGFDLGRSLADADKPDSFGLEGMRERVAEHSGHLIIRSIPGSGTEIRARVPIRAGSEITYLYGDHVSNY